MRPAAREEFKRLAHDLAVDSIVTVALERLLEQVLCTVVETERKRCIGLVLEEADQRLTDGDPEGSGVLHDLAKQIAA
jgi:hypothetical protein